MKIKKGDKVKLLTGKDKGKTGKVLQVFPSRNKASVERLNLLIKHMRPRKQGEKGQRIEFPALMDLSNMMLVCPKCNKPTRIGYKYLEITTAGVSAGVGQEKKKKRKVRICKKCKQVI
ncbi:MAG: 50S ribosomal protein L24 [Patescibacteria group bacterium]|nr:50S ribosomal protein L24 [Patescibacteria group bacterium]